MEILEAKQYVTRALSTMGAVHFHTPAETIDLVTKYTRITLGDEKTVSGTPKLGYIPSNIKGVYYVIFCDNCNAKCRKAYPTLLNIRGDKVMKFLCGKCAGKKYERKKEYERKALEYLLHPNKLAGLNYNNLPLKQCLAVLEAGFMEEKLRERAEKNVSKYIDGNH